MGRATDNAHVICNKCSHVAEWHACNDCFGSTYVESIVDSVCETWTASEAGLFT